MSDADINFCFDPVCPFAWMTSKWVRLVQTERDYTVDWRFISLRLINAAIDYDAHFPAGYESGHTAGLRLLRVAARARAQQGRAAIDPLYAALGERIFDTAPDPEGSDGGYRGTRTFLEPALVAAGLPLELADALDDETYDAELRRETDEALALTAVGYGPADTLRGSTEVVRRVRAGMMGGVVTKRLTAMPTTNCVSSSNDISRSARTTSPSRPAAAGWPLSRRPSSTVAVHQRR